MSTIERLRGLMKSHNFAVKHVENMRVVRDRQRDLSHEAGNAESLNAELMFDAALERRDDVRHDLVRAMHAALPKLLAVCEAAQAMENALMKWNVPCPDHVADAVCDLHSALAALASAQGGEGEK